MRSIFKAELNSTEIFLKGKFVKQTNRKQGLQPRGWRAALSGSRKGSASGKCFLKTSLNLFYCTLNTKRKFKQRNNQLCHYETETMVHSREGYHLDHNS